MFSNKNGKTVFSPQNMCMNFEILKMCESYTFWKIDISMIILFFFVDLIRDLQKGVLSPWSVMAWWGPHPTQLKRELTCTTSSLLIQFVSYQLRTWENQPILHTFSLLACWVSLIKIEFWVCQTPSHLSSFPLVPFSKDFNWAHLLFEIPLHC